MNSDITGILLKGLVQEIDKILDEEVESACKRVTERIKGRTNQIALNVLSHFSIERMRDELVIKVKFDP